MDVPQFIYLIWTMLCWLWASEQQQVWGDMDPGPYQLMNGFLDMNCHWEKKIWCFYKVLVYQRFYKLTFKCQTNENILVSSLPFVEKLEKITWYLSEDQYLHN